MIDGIYAVVTVGEDGKETVIVRRSEHGAKLMIFPTVNAEEDEANIREARQTILNDTRFAGTRVKFLKFLRDADVGEIDRRGEAKPRPRRVASLIAQSR